MQRALAIVLHSGFHFKTGDELWFTKATETQQQVGVSNHLGAPALWAGVQTGPWLRTPGLAPGGFWVGLDDFLWVFLFVWFGFFTLLFDLEPFISFSFSFLLFVCPFHLLCRGCGRAPHAVCTAPGEPGSRVSRGLRPVAQTRWIVIK